MSRQNEWWYLSLNEAEVRTPKIQNVTKLPPEKIIKSIGDQKSSWIMNLEENSWRNHESLRQKRQESWVRYDSNDPASTPDSLPPPPTLNTVLYSLRYHHFALEMMQFIHPVLPETSVPFFDSSMSMFPHINSVCKSAFYYLRNISRIRNSYPWRPPRFSSMLLYLKLDRDYCNSVLYNVPKYVM